MRKTPAAFLPCHCLTDAAAFPCPGRTGERNTPRSGALPLGWPPAPQSSLRAGSGSRDLQAYLGWLAGAPATSPGRAGQTPGKLTNDLPSLIRV